MDWIYQPLTVPGKTTTVHDAAATATIVITDTANLSRVPGLILAQNSSTIVITDAPTGTEICCGKDSSNIVITTGVTSNVLRRSIAAETIVITGTEFGRKNLFGAGLSNIVITTADNGHRICAGHDSSNILITSAINGTEIWAGRSSDLIQILTGISGTELRKGIISSLIQIIGTETGIKTLFGNCSQSIVINTNWVGHKIAHSITQPIIVITDTANLTKLGSGLIDAQSAMLIRILGNEAAVSNLIGASSSLIRFLTDVTLRKVGGDFVLGQSSSLIQISTTDLGHCIFHSGSSGTVRITDNLFGRLTLKGRDTSVIVINDAAFGSAFRNIRSNSSIIISDVSAGSVIRDGKTNSSIVISTSDIGRILKGSPVAATIRIIDTINSHMSRSGNTAPSILLSTFLSTKQTMHAPALFDIDILCVPIGSLISGNTSGSYRNVYLIKYIFENEYKTLYVDIDNNVTIGFPHVISV